MNRKMVPNHNNCFEPLTTLFAIEHVELVVSGLRNSSATSPDTCALAVSTLPREEPA